MKGNNSPNFFIIKSSLETRDQAMKDFSNEIATLPLVARNDSKESGRRCENSKQ